MAGWCFSHGLLSMGPLLDSFYVKFMRYMLPIYPLFTLMAAALLTSTLQLSLVDWQLSSL